MLKWLVALVMWSSLASATEPDWSLYGELLQKYVTEGEVNQIQANLVDYQGLANDVAFKQVVDAVRQYDVSTLEGKNEALAFYINAYNILTIQLIIDHWPVASIRDIGSIFRGPWDIVMLENTAGKLTLDDIEHKIVRSYGEPRIHFAVNCASLSCPDLRREPYRAARLGDQLEDQTHRFLLNTGKGTRLEGDTLHVSRIFDWYDEDFEASGGVGPFIRQSLKTQEGLAQQNSQPGFRKVRADLPYNWQLNIR